MVQFDKLLVCIAGDCLNFSLKKLRPPTVCFAVTGARAGLFLIGPTAASYIILD